MYAVSNNNYYLTDFLIKSGADVNAEDNTGYTALMSTAAKFEGNNCNLAALLIKNGADVNAKNNDGVTPLMYATFRNNYEVIKLLIKKGADVNARDYSESTA